MRKKKQIIKEIIQEVEKIKKELWNPEYMTIPCVICKKEFIIEERHEALIMETELPCDNCVKLDKIKSDIKDVFKDKEFVQCLKELMKEKDEN